MPRGDGTGPAGMGQMTGRAAGFCAGNSVPGYANPIPGRGFFGGGGGGFGRGRGLGRGMGTGRRFGVAPPPVVQGPGQAEESAMLKQQAEAMSLQLRQIQERIDQLDSEQKG